VVYNIGFTTVVSA